uniref:Uncharacterized protein n=1 Tax=Poecilia latipinna TaxID=48699 RepID=A0A3B3UIP7_9TELE
MRFTVKPYQFVFTGPDLNLFFYVLENSVLHFFFSGDTDIVKILLENGANPCLRTVHGWTAAHYAAESGHLAALRMLHTFHAPMDKEDCCGDKPIRLAEIYGKEDCVRFLKKAELEYQDFREKLCEEGILNDSDTEWLQQSKEYEEDIAFRTRRKTKSRLSFH